MNVGLMEQISAIPKPSLRRMFAIPKYALHYRGLIECPRVLRPGPTTTDETKGEFHGLVETVELSST